MAKSINKEQSHESISNPRAPFCRIGKNANYHLGIGQRSQKSAKTASILDSEGEYTASPWELAACKWIVAQGFVDTFSVF